jgi:guanidinoacetate N-methyltransferase
MKGNEKLIISDESIKIPEEHRDGIVMHKGEKSLMRKLAEIATKNGGDILEIGFGMHLSADGVQSNPNVTSHTIIEVHPEIYKHALSWAKNKPNTEIILGDWIDILPTLDKKFDGVLHDTHLDTNLPKFLDYIKPNCKINTIVAFFEYNGNRNYITGVRIPMVSDEYESLPYKDNNAFLKNSYELQYTIFNGNTFTKDKNIKQLI